MRCPVSHMLVRSAEGVKWLSRAHKLGAQEHGTDADAATRERCCGAAPLDVQKGTQCFFEQFGTK